MRVPFSVYLKPWQQRAELGDETVGLLSPMFVIPLDKIDVNAGIKIRSNAKEVARLAAASSAKIPDASKSMNLLAKAYLRSPLARFHNWFYSEEHDADALWPKPMTSRPWTRCRQTCATSSNIPMTFFCDQGA
jgi:hypothetical protein